MPDTPLNRWASSKRPRLILSHKNFRYFPQPRYETPDPDDHQVLLVHPGLAQSLIEARCRGLFSLPPETPLQMFDLETHPKPPGVLFPPDADVARAAEEYTTSKVPAVYLKLDAEDAWRTLGPLAALSLRVKPKPVYIASHNLSPFIAADPYSAFDQVCTIFISPWLTLAETRTAFQPPEADGEQTAQIIWETTGGEPLLLQTLYDHPAADRLSAMRRWASNPPSFVEAWKHALRERLEGDPEIRRIVRAAISTRGVVERLSWTSLPLVYGGWVTDRRDSPTGPSWYMPKLHQTWANSLLIQMGA